MQYFCVGWNSVRIISHYYTDAEVDYPWTVLGIFQCFEKELLPSKIARSSIKVFSKTFFMNRFKMRELLPLAVFSKTAQAVCSGKIVFEHFRQNRIFEGNYFMGKNNKFEKHNSSDQISMRLQKRSELTKAPLWKQLSVKWHRWILHSKFPYATLFSCQN